MDVGSVSGLDSTRRETRFQTAVVTANAKSTVDVEGHVSQVACSSRRAADDYAIDECRRPDAGTQREQKHIAPTMGHAPKNLADESCARVVVGIKWQVIYADKFAQQTSF